MFMYMYLKTACGYMYVHSDGESTNIRCSD